MTCVHKRSAVCIEHLTIACSVSQCQYTNFNVDQSKKQNFACMSNCVFMIVSYNIAFFRDYFLGNFINWQEIATELSQHGAELFDENVAKPHTIVTTCNRTQYCFHYCNMQTSVTASYSYSRRHLCIHLYQCAAKAVRQSNMHQHRFFQTFCDYLSTLMFHDNKTQFILFAGLQ